MATAADPARAVGLAGATALVVGQVIAVGIFLTPGTIIRTVASPLGVLLVWAAMGIMAVCGALCYGALAARYPHDGGGYVYLREAYGPRLAFVYGWKCLLVMDPGITAALATGFAAYVAHVRPLGEPGVRLVAVAAIAVFAAVHVVGVPFGMRLLSALSVVKVGLVLALTGAAMSSAAADWSHFVPLVARRPEAPPLAAALAGALVSAFFSFGGWWEVTKLGGEVRDPARTVPRALLLGLSVVTATYAIVTLAFIAIVPVERVADGQAFAAQLGAVVFGPGGGVVVALVVACCVLGSLGATQLLAPRLYFAMARDGLFPAAAAALHPRHGTPARAIVIQAGLASVLVWFGSFDTIVAYFVFVTVVFIALTVGSVFVERRRDAAFHVPGHPWTALVFLALVAGLLVLIAAGNPRQALLGTVVVAVAFPVHRLIRTRHPVPADAPAGSS